MSDHPAVLTATQTTPRRTELQMQRITWVAVVLGMAAWLSLGVLVGRWGIHTLRSASAPAPSVLASVAGVVLYREANQRNDVSAEAGIQLFDGDELATSFGSNAVVRLFDGTNLELFPEARIRIEAARVGRFNPAATEARIAIERGAARLTVPDLADRPHGVTMVTPHARATFAGGAYTLRVGQSDTRVSVWDGESSVQGSGEPIMVGSGEKVIASRDGPALRVVNVLENIVVNGDFRERYEAWEPWDEREQGRPDVPGSLDLTNLAAGQRALRVTRDSIGDAHNETGLRQRLGRDVNGARAIVLQAQVKVDYSSLSGGGYLGSEFPIMVRIRARDRRGGEQVWTHGFYYANPENRPVDRGTLVPRREWVAYAMDLTDVMGPLSTIESIEVFGAGHTFDASISQVQLLVD